MKKYYKIITAIAVVGVILAGLTYNYTFNSDHRNIANEQAEVTITATELNAQFLANEALATATYLDKVIEIEGTITAIETDEIVLNNVVQIQFDSEILTTQKTEASLRVKGRCVGYDELIEMVKIDQAVLIKK
jgi:hypothetical protein